MELRNSPQVDLLLDKFESYLHVFDLICPFGEDKVTVHRDTIAIVRAASKPVDVLDNELWFRKMAETLALWGMNIRGARLNDLSEIRASFIELRSSIVDIQDCRLETIDLYYAVITGRKIGVLLENLRVGRQRAKLVANTKALHHLLPDLVPPVDRKYTLKFFFDDSNIVQRYSAQYLFEEMWPAFHKIAQEAKHIIQNYLGQGMHTSIPKTIDNAIVGYIKIKEL